MNCKRLKNLTYPINCYLLLSKHYFNTYDFRGMFVCCGVEEVILNMKAMTSSNTNYTMKNNGIFNNLFYHSDIQRFTFNLLDFPVSSSFNPSEANTGTIFESTPNLNHVSIPNIKKAFPSGVTVMANGPETGTIIVSNDDGISAGTNGVPEGWTVEYALN